MKIIRLSLNNLASLAGTHEINFEATPLAQAGLIAITGKTGAGKSTLLDAMCLALYDGIPRLPDSENPHSRRKSTIVDASGQAISINDPKNILRRGTTSGFAELEFVALDQKRYIARWEIQRARKKVDGNLSTNRSVFCVDEARLMTQKTSECTPFIERITGLTFKQFTRAVLLAQSEVGAFLKAKDQERADLLEYLTNSQIFSEVSKRAAEKHSEVKHKRSELESRIGDLELLSDEQLAELNTQSTQLKTSIEQVTIKEKLLENDLKWHQTRHELYTETQAKKEVYLVHVDADQHMQSQKQQLQYLDQFQPIRDVFNQHHHAKQQAQQITEKLADFLPEIQQIEQQHQHAITAKQQAETNLQNWQVKLQHLKPYLAEAQQLDQDIQSQGQIYTTQKKQLDDLIANEVLPLQQELESKQQQLNLQQQSYQHSADQLLASNEWSMFDDIIPSTLQQLQHYEQQADKLRTLLPTIFDRSSVQLKTEIAQLKTSLETWHNQYQSLAAFEQLLQNKQNEIAISTQQLYQLDQVKQATLRWQNDTQQLKTYEQNRQDLKDQFNQLTQQQAEQKNIADQALQHFKQTQKVFEQQRLLQHQSVQILRDQLRPDEPCMVCGSQQHPYISHAELLAQSLKNLQDQQLIEAEQQAQQAQQNLQNTVIAISRLEANLQQLVQNIEQLKLATSKQIDELKDLSQATHIDLDLTQEPSQVLMHLEQHLQDHQQGLASIQSDIAQLQPVLAQWRETQKKLSDLNVLKQQIEQLDQILMPIQHILANHPLQQQLINHPLEFCTHAAQTLNSRAAQMQTHLAQEKMIEQSTQEVTQLQHRLSYLNDKHGALNTMIEQTIQSGKSLRIKLDGLTEMYAGQIYKKFNNWQTDLDQQSQNYMQQLDAQRNSAQQAEQLLHQKRLTQQDLISQQTQFENRIISTQHMIDDWKSTHPQFEEALITQCLAIDHQTHQSIRSSIEKQQEMLSNAKTAWQTLEEQYEKHLKIEPALNFDDVQTQLAELHTDKTQQQAQFNEIDALIRLNKSKQDTYTKYQDQITAVKAEEYRWGRIYDLIGHKEGTKFKKIAQEHHLDILVEYANQQLQPLSARYQLHRIPESLGLAIIDLDMNNEIRPVLSLSGGETFLVSLALALAIANMASGSMKLESLFIDEGFGTLDPSSLHMVMNALDTLQDQGRKVVLISHIQEMHERIPVQIQVLPRGNGSSELKFVG